MALMETRPRSGRKASSGQAMAGQQVIFPRFSGHSGLTGHALLGLFGGKVPDGRVHAMAVVVPLYVSQQRLPRLGVRRPSALMGEFDLEGVEKLSIGALS